LLRNLQADFWADEKTKEYKSMKVGDRVRVKTSVMVYHHPEHKQQPFDLKETEGEVMAILKDWQGRPISANLPILVKFDKRLKAHFREDELEVIAV